MTLHTHEIPHLSAVHFTNHLMLSFASQVEATIHSQISQFKQSGAHLYARRESYAVEESNISQYLEHYQGLVNQELKPDEIVTEYFPSLQRRSAFLTIYSVYEVELQAMCRHSPYNSGGKDFDHSRGSGSGIIKVNNYLEKYFPGLKNSEEWQLLDRIRVLRNHCVHYNGNTSRGNKPVRKIAQLIEAHPYLFHHDGPEEPEGEKYTDGSAKRTGRNIIFETRSLFFIIEAFRAYIAMVNRRAADTLSPHIQ